MLTNNTKKYSLFFIIILITFFLIFKFSVFFAEPTIVIYDFDSNKILTTEENTYIIKGIAQGSKNLYINDREILLNTDFTFSEKLYLSDYQNIFIIKSISKIGPIFQRKIEIYKK
jgi:hypothetical protein